MNCIDICIPLGSDLSPYVPEQNDLLPELWVQKWLQSWTVTSHPQKPPFFSPFTLTANAVIFLTCKSDLWTSWIKILQWFLTACRTKCRFLNLSDKIHPSSNFPVLVLPLLQIKNINGLLNFYWVPTMNTKIEKNRNASFPQKGGFVEKNLTPIN